jgi:hypothetical protein
MLQRPAMEAAATMLVPEAHCDRANAIRQITGPMAGMLAPVSRGFVNSLVGVDGVMVIPCTFQDLQWCRQVRRLRIPPPLFRYVAILRIADA